MEELIAKLEQASAGNRKLDAEVGLSVGDYKLGNGGRTIWNMQRGEINFVCGSGTDEPIDDPITALFGCLSLPHYTTSLDAALTLVPKGYGWCIDAAQMSDGIVYRTVVGGSMAVWAASPALTLCIAALKARVDDRP